MTRLTELTPEEMTPEQKEAVAGILAGPRNRLAGPMNAWLRSPDFCDKAQRLGAFCRFQSSLDKRISELAILLTARHWRAQFEWYAHAPMALAAGLDKAIVDAIRERRRPERMADDETVVYDLFHQLYEARRVEDATYARAKALFGERGVVDLVGVMGYYSLVSMSLNTFEVPLPEGVAEPLD